MSLAVPPPTVKKTTAIEWTDHTLNFWWGCTKVSPACAHCYAEAWAKYTSPKLFGKLIQWGPGKDRGPRLEAARKEALRLNKEAAKCRLINGTVWLHTGICVIIGKPDSRRIHAAPQHIPLKKRAFADYQEFTQAEWDAAPQPRPRVFVNSMSDWLDDQVPIEWLAYLLETLHLCPHLDFQLLTKRPENWNSRVSMVLTNLSDSGLYDPTKHGWLSDWRHNIKAPPNLWIGTTVENQEWADKRLPHLLAIPAKVRFLSCEPLMGPLDLRQSPALLEQFNKSPWGWHNWLKHKIHWVIAGGESGHHARPTHPDWIRSLRDQCAEAHVPFLFKQWGEWIPTDQTAPLAPEFTNPNKKYRGYKHLDNTISLRVGKDHTGRHLDGIEHTAFPQSQGGAA